MTLFEAVTLMPNATGNTTLRSVYHYLEDVRQYDEHTERAIDLIVHVIDEQDSEITLAELFPVEYGGYQP